MHGHDALVRSGAMKIVSGRRFPIGLGLDFAGVVAATGPGVDGVRTGKPVWGTVHPREKHPVAGAAEYVAVAADRVAPVPAGLSAVQAAASVRRERARGSPGGASPWRPGALLVAAVTLALDSGRVVVRKGRGQFAVGVGLLE